MKMVLDLFSGIGGFSLGLESTGAFRTVAFCEIEEFPRKVLRKHWPDIPIHEDIYNVSGYAYRGVDVITGGFPCQPISIAGKGKGKEDPRWLWPQMLRVIREARPRWCIVENSPRLRTLHGDDVLGDLEELGYTCWPLVVGAGAAGTSHKRKRVWVVAHTNGTGLAQRESQRSNTCSEQPALVGGHRQWAWERAPEPVLRRVDDGLPCRVDRRERLKALGNSVVPQLVRHLGHAILWTEMIEL